MPILYKLLPAIFGTPEYVEPIFGPQIPSIWWKSYGIHLFLQLLLFLIIAFAGTFFIWMMCNIRRYIPRKPFDEEQLNPAQEPPIDYSPPARRTFSQPRTVSAYSVAKTY